MGSSTIRGTDPEDVVQPPTDVEITDQTIALVPRKSYAERYIPRTLQGNLLDQDVYRISMGEGWSILIEGPTGTGKTLCSLAYAATQELPFYSVPSNVGIEPSQLFGRWAPDGEGGYEWVDGPVTVLVRNGGVLLINEVNFLPDRIATVLFGLLDIRKTIQLLDHKGEIIEAHRKDCWCDLPIDECKRRWLLVIADMNPDYRGTRMLNEAFRNRFPVKMAWDYDPVVEEKLVPYRKLRDLAYTLRDAPNISTPVATNMLMDLVTQTLGPFGWDFARMNFLNTFVSKERKAVEEALRTTEDQIRAELTNVHPTEIVEEDVDSEWDESKYDLSIKGTPDNPNPHNYPNFEKAREEGDDWGVYGVDWHLKTKFVDSNGAA